VGQSDNGDFSFVEKTTYDKLLSIHHTSEAARAYFVKIYNAKVDSNDNGILGLFANPTEFYLYNTYYNADKNLVTDEEPVAITAEEYEAFSADYSKYLKFGADEYTSKAVNNNLKAGSLAFFIVALLLIIISQTVIRTPAVSLMPDVTPTP
jgi:hypothetical protein